MNYRIKTNQEYLEAYRKSIDSPEDFWEEIATSFQWNKKWDTVLNWNFTEPDIRWFEGGELNITVNMLDRHLPQRKDQVAYYWEPNEISETGRSITYGELFEDVCRLANGLRSIGIGKGDKVCIYLPMIPEAIISILACARIGAVHSIVFAGFSANALAGRIQDAEAKMIITANTLRRGNKIINLKEIADEALINCPSVQHRIIIDDSKEKILNERETDYQKLVAPQAKFAEPEWMEAEDMLFILYTSGSTGKPKGVVHSIAGYMLYTAYTFANVFQYDEDDVFWCTADIGWITGHSYMIYGPLLNGATSVLFEGIPTYPDPSRFWQVCEKYQVNQFYTAPTAIRSLMSYGKNHVESFHLNSLKVIGSVGEPINDEAWHWYKALVGKNRCPIVDTWWQTETGGIMLSGLGGLSPQKSTYAGHPLPGIQPVLLDHEGNEITQAHVEGYLCIRFPWPGMLRTTYGDHERCRQTYFSNYKSYYFTGDGAKRDSDGMYRIIGRVDDVINVSGHRFGTAEIEDAIDESSFAIEAAVVGFPHEIKGQGIFAYVVVDPDHLQEDIKKIYADIEACVERQIGKIAKPDRIVLTTSLPKTRSGKIMRRILRKLAEGERNDFGDTSTLLDPGVVDELLKKI